FEPSLGETVVVHEVYVSPNINIKTSNKALVLGDINAKSPRADERGDFIKELMARLRWCSTNNLQPTFERRNSKSHINVTLTSNTLLSKI
ncbi:hypothetical protein HHI36_008800, partial [Cryptolaemus montrouzieri]